MIWLINGIVFSVALTVLAQLISLYRSSGDSFLRTQNRIRLFLSGFIANIADTLGLGSFAIIVAIDKTWKLMEDRQLPGTLNCQSVFPSLLQSFLFLTFIEMDFTLLGLFVLAGSVGGFTGGYLVSRLDKQSIRIGMSLGFGAIALLILANQLHLLPVAGSAVSLEGTKLALGFVGMLLVGMLPSIGVGFYAPVQVLLFLLGLSPLVAFPIMSTVGVIVQSSAAIAFIRKKEVAVSQSLWLMLSGIAGVLVAVPMVTYVEARTLRWLLLVIVSYNAVVMFRSYLQEKKRLFAAGA